MKRKVVEVDGAAERVYIYKLHSVTAYTHAAAETQLLLFRKSCGDRDLQQLSEQREEKKVKTRTGKNRSTSKHQL